MSTAWTTIFPKTKTLLISRPGSLITFQGFCLTSLATWLAAQKARTSSRGQPMRPSVFLQCVGRLVSIFSTLFAIKADQHYQYFTMEWTFSCHDKWSDPYLYFSLAHNLKTLPHIQIFFYISNHCSPIGCRAHNWGMGQALQNGCYRLLSASRGGAMGYSREGIRVRPSNCNTTLCLG